VRNRHHLARVRDALLVQAVELERPVYPEDFTLATIRDRLARANDPLASLLSAPQSLKPLLESGRSRRARPMA